jgi:phage terminase small subunit
MPNGQPKPLSLVQGHRTIAEKQVRAKAEKSLYTGEQFFEVASVKADPLAHKEFVRLKRLYSKIAFIDALDQQLINRYCLELSNLEKLQKNLIELQYIADETDQMDVKIAILDRITRISQIMMKSKELILKYEDRLFLNPASRVKSVPKTPEKAAELSGIDAFLAKRADRR